jgi:hypothetical protein
MSSYSPILRLRTGILGIDRHESLWDSRVIIVVVIVTMVDDPADVDVDGADECSTAFLCSPLFPAPYSSCVGARSSSTARPAPAATAASTIAIAVAVAEEDDDVDVSGNIIDCKSVSVKLTLRRG